MTETFWRIWSPTRGYWDGGYLREPSSWDCGPAMASVQLDVAQARRWLQSMRGGANPPCPDARLVRVTVRRKERSGRASKNEEAGFVMASGPALKWFYRDDTELHSLRARVSELEAQLADRTDALRTFQNVPREE